VVPMTKDRLSPWKKEEKRGFNIIRALRTGSILIF